MLSDNDLEKPQRFLPGLQQHLRLSHRACVSAGGMLIGLAFGVAVRWLLRWMRQRDAGRDQQICLTLAVAYLSFYVANSPAEVSGMIFQAPRRPRAQMCNQCHPVVQQLG